MTLGRGQPRKNRGERSGLVGCGSGPDLFCRLETYQLQSKIGGETDVVPIFIPPTALLKGELRDSSDSPHGGVAVRICRMQILSGMSMS